MDLAQYVRSDATTLAALVAAGETTPSELLALARRRNADVDPHLNAVVADLGDLADERAADPALTGPQAGPLAGVPFLLKDLEQEYAGVPTSYGSRALVDDVATEHALVTRRLLDAGVVVWGKTNTPELGAKGVTEPELWGATHNPWRLGRTPGGSSGGAGAAVAAGVVPAAGANDGGGSIRIPAACNGLVGLKTSRGLSPQGPRSGELVFGMVTQGVVSRTVRDSAAMLDAVIGPDPEADYAAALPPTPFVKSIAREPRRLRIGFSAASAVAGTPHPQAVAAVEAAAALLADLGHEVEEVAQPHDDGALARDFLAIWFAQLHGQVVEIKRRTGATDRDFEADTLASAELGRAGGTAALFSALGRVHHHVRALAAFHRSHDLLLTPTLAAPPVEVGSLRTPDRLQRVARVAARARTGRLLSAAGLVDQIIDENIAWVPYTQLANLTGRPAISLPLHWTPDGLPLGVQLVGALGTDALLLQVAAQVERARPWAHRYADLDPALPRPV